VEDVLLGRLEKFKQKRNLRRKYFLAALLFFLLLTAGLLSVDYSTNFLINGQHGIAMVAFSNKEANLEVAFMNKKLYINTQYINRDLKKLKKRLEEVFGT